MRRLTCLLVLLAALVAGCSRPAGEGAPAARWLSPVAAMAAADLRGFERALEPREFVFPRDHGPHPGFRTEWWYFVGHLEAAGERRFGYQLTFFRHALAASPPPRPSPWAARDLYMAHFALTDVDGGDFHAAERFARGAAGLAGARIGGDRPFRVWLESWSVASVGESAGESFWPLRLEAGDGDVRLALALEAGKPPVLQGEAGLSRKGEAPGQASYYYSLTRLPSRGVVELGGERFEVAGESWLDREWSTSVLSPEQSGWDWFALQLDDGRELMFYHLRRRSGDVEPASHGVLVGPEGASRHLALADVDLEVTRTWESPRGGRYPAAWRLRVPAESLDLEIEPLLADQEHTGAFRYWEGVIAVRGTASGAPVAGRGYAELVGYAEEQ